jgi:hypothetical protein
MASLRWLVLLLLVAAGLSFACFAITGQTRFKVFGLRVLRWTVVGAFAFFGVLILERLA